MKIAILGGTFNPPHYGHMFLANEVRSKFGYDKIIFVPSNIPAHKSTHINSLHRLEMTRLITDDYDWAEVSDCDIKRGGITRSIDTISDIEKEYPVTDKVGFIIGDDLLHNFKSWKNPDELVNKCQLLIAKRDNFSIDNFEYSHLVVENREFPLSSSEIRNRVTKNLNIDFLLPPNVIKYILINGLYRKDS